MENNVKGEIQPHINLQFVSFEDYQILEQLICWGGDGLISAKHLKKKKEKERQSALAKRCTVIQSLEVLHFEGE